MKTLLALLVRIIPALCAAALLSSCGTFGNYGTEVTVAADRTKAGAKFVPPTAEKPAYYYLVSVGALELGAVYAGEEKMPGDSEVEPLIVTHLAKQNYIRAATDTPKPSLVIAYAWGSINPDEIDTGDPDLPPAQVNRGQILAIVSTNKSNTMPGSPEMLMDTPDLSDGRHFLLIGAYDLDSFGPGKKRSILWRAKLSTSNSGGVTLAAALPTLLDKGSDFFGQDGLPVTLIEKIRKGTVTVGEATVVEDKPGDNTAGKGKTSPPAKTE
ncbi:MAG: hypothetical protein LBM92_03195 [Opitutaceae bacterium]|jgi:hypothetical protein|nr:hypothetical protein [Opitutaceae bacterium]